MIARKKPIEIECLKLTEDNLKRIMEWCPACVPEYAIHEGRYLDVESPVYGRELTGLIIHTLEGDVRASIGDYIIKGVNGEFYPCKPNIFEKTYEVIEE